jgi:hypothetical protein
MFLEKMTNNPLRQVGSITRFNGAPWSPGNFSDITVMRED